MNLEGWKLDILLTVPAMSIKSCDWVEPLTFCRFSDFRGSLNALIVSSIRLAHAHDVKDATAAKEVIRTMTSDQASLRTWSKATPMPVFYSSVIAVMS